jgi:hypothetical protein
VRDTRIVGGNRGLNRYRSERADGSREATETMQHGWLAKTISVRDRSGSWIIHGSKKVVENTSHCLPMLSLTILRDIGPVYSGRSLLLSATVHFYTLWKINGATVRFGRTICFCRSCIALVAFRSEQNIPAATTCSIVTRLLIPNMSQCKH